MEELLLYTDGGARGNPGPAALGLVIYDQTKKLLEYKQTLGVATNNIAEYSALIKGLTLAEQFKPKHLKCYSDSELLIRQMKGIYKVRAPHILELFKKVKEKEFYFEKVTYHHVNRTNPFIGEADRLVNEALDEKK